MATATTLWYCCSSKELWTHILHVRIFIDIISWQPCVISKYPFSFIRIFSFFPIYIRYSVTRLTPSWWRTEDLFSTLYRKCKCRWQVRWTWPPAEGRQIRALLLYCPVDLKHTEFGEWKPKLVRTFLLFRAWTYPQTNAFLSEVYVMTKTFDHRILSCWCTNKRQ